MAHTIGARRRKSKRTPEVRARQWRIVRLIHLPLAEGREQILSQEVWKMRDRMRPSQADVLPLATQALQDEYLTFWRLCEMEIALRDFIPEGTHLVTYVLQARAWGAWRKVIEVSEIFTHMTIPRIKYKHAQRPPKEP